VDLNIPSQNGRTPLAMAVTREDADIVQLLLTYPRTDVNMRDKDGLTPLELSRQDAQIILHPCLKQTLGLRLNATVKLHHWHKLEVAVIALSSRTLRPRV